MVKNSIEHLQNLAPHHYLDLQMNYWATYHHHKEQMGYVATALFLTGATTIMFFDLELTSCLEWARLLFTIIVTLLSGIAFVFWQLNNREFAAHMIRACGLLSARWITKPPETKDFEFSKKISGQFITKSLANAFYEAKFSYTFFKHPAFAKWITVIVMIVWGLAVILRVWSLRLCSYCLC